MHQHIPVQFSLFDHIPFQQHSLLCLVYHSAFLTQVDGRFSSLLKMRCPLHSLLSQSSTSHSFTARTIFESCSCVLVLPQRFRSNHASQGLFEPSNGLTAHSFSVVIWYYCRSLSVNMSCYSHWTVRTYTPVPKATRVPLMLRFSAMPATQYLLTVNPGPVNISPRAVAPTYISANGSTTTDCSAAAPFALTSGQLSSNGQFVSTTGLVPYSPLVVSSYLAAISTTFSTMTVMNGSSLAWNNTAFTGGHALFCVMGNTVEAVYNGQLPAGCAQIYIGYVFVTACPTFKPSNSVTQLAGGATGTGTSSPSPTASLSGSVKGKNVTANPLGCLSSSGNSPAVSGGLIPKTVTTLEDCADFCSSYAYFGVQSGESTNPLSKWR